MARNRKNTDDDPQAEPLPAAAGGSARRGGGGGGGASKAARARPTPGSKEPKTGSVTKAVQRGRWSQLLTEVVAELKKVSWPTRQQLMQATLVVIVAVAIIAAFLGLADQASEWIVDRIF